MRRTTLSVLSALAILLSGMIVPGGRGTKSPRQRTNVCTRETLRGQETSPPYRKENKERDPNDRRRYEPYAHVFRLDRQPGQALAGQLPIHQGLSKTYCANRLITDSGAGGTALATGHKTNYHMVGVDPEGKPWNL